MDIKIIKRIEKANQNNLSDSTKISIVLMFFIVVSIIAVAFGARANVLVLVFSAVIGAYMAMNVGANDVANNVGPAVGSKAITLLGAIAIAAIFEALGRMAVDHKRLGIERADHMHHRVNARHRPAGYADIIHRFRLPYADVLAHYTSRRT